MDVIGQTKPVASKQGKTTSFKVVLNDKKEVTWADRSAKNNNPLMYDTNP